MTFRKSKVTPELTQLYRFREVSFYALFKIKPITVAGSAFQNVPRYTLSGVDEFFSESGNLKFVAKNCWGSLLRFSMFQFH